MSMRVKAPDNIALSIGDLVSINDGVAVPGVINNINNPVFGYVTTVNNDGTVDVIVNSIVNIPDPNVYDDTYYRPIISGTTECYVVPRSGIDMSGDTIACSFINNRSWDGIFTGNYQTKKPVKKKEVLQDVTIKERPKRKITF